MPDLQTVLKKVEIEWVKTTMDALNINCPFCHKPDTRHHLGIFQDMKGFHCFRCGKSGTLYILFSRLFNMSFDDFKKLMVNDLLPNETAADKIKVILKGKIKETEKQKKQIKLPQSILINQETVELYPTLRGFLRARNITVETCEKYKTRYTGYLGDLAYRIIIPIPDLEGENLISWQARDVTGKSKTKYYTAPHSPVKDYVYPASRIDYSKPLYIVEGVFDVWRLQENAVAIFGKQLSAKQETLLTEEFEFTPIIIALDSDATKQAWELAHKLACQRSYISIQELPKGEDPDSLGKEKLKHLTRNEIA